MTWSTPSLMRAAISAPTFALDDRSSGKLKDLVDELAGETPSDPH